MTSCHTQIDELPDERWQAALVDLLTPGLQVRRRRDAVQTMKLHDVPTLKCDLCVSNPIIVRHCGRHPGQAPRPRCTSIVSTGAGDSAFQPQRGPEN